MNKGCAGGTPGGAEGRVGPAVVLMHVPMRTRTVDFHPIMPMGFFSMADCLDRAGIPVRIVNVAAENRVRPGVAVEDLVDGAPIVAIGLHWYLHSHDVIRCVERLKSARPDVRVVLGGYTATVFAEEILEGHPEVDAVITGEGEVPLVEYARAVLDGGDLESVCNLVHRRGGRVMRNARSWVASKAEFDTFSFSRLDLLSNAGTYLELCTRSPVVQYTAAPEQPDRTFYLPVGRGCRFLCSCCGGNASATRFISGRHGFTFRDPGRVFDDILSLWQAGCRNFHVGSPMAGEGHGFFADLFARLRQAGIRPGLMVEAWSMPDADFLAGMAGAVDLRHSGVSVSPDSGSEHLRRSSESRRPFFSNEGLLDWAEAARSRGLMPMVAFTVGQHAETRAHHEETLGLIDLLVRRNVRVGIMACKLDPGSDLAVHPERYGVTLYRKTFRDYCDHTRDLCHGTDQEHPLGYRTREFTEGEILQMQIGALRHGYLHVRNAGGRAPTDAVTAWHAVQAFLGIVFRKNHWLNLGTRQ